VDEYNVQKAIEAQAKHCKETGDPHFAPYSGICWSCGRQIYSSIEHEKKNWQTGEVNGTYITGITVEKATKLVTGCPHCNRSYCD
jgi:hypothetical protein